MRPVLAHKAWWLANVLDKVAHLEATAGDLLQAPENPSENLGIYSFWAFAAPTIQSLSGNVAADGFV